MGDILGRSHYRLTYYDRLTFGDWFLSLISDANHSGAINSKELIRLARHYDRYYDSTGSPNILDQSRTNLSRYAIPGVHRLF